MKCRTTERCTSYIKYHSRHVPNKDITLSKTTSNAISGSGENYNSRLKPFINPNVTKSHVHSIQDKPLLLNATQCCSRHREHLPAFDVLDQTHLYSLTGRASSVSGKRTALSHAPACFLHHS